MRGRTTRALGALLVVAASLALHGCPPSGARLTVRVQSGLRAGDELRHLRAFLRRGGSCAEGEELRSEGRALERTDQVALGDGSLTVAELGPLEPGVYAVQVLGRRPGATGAESGAVLIERCVVASITNDRVLRIALTTGCVGVTCPAPGGSTAFSECLNGRCVDPRCDPDDPVTAPFCCDRELLGDVCDEDPTLCRESRDCERVTDCAGDPRCENGACIEPTEDLCDVDQHCDVTMRACVPDDPTVFADAGPTDDAGAAEADAGLDTGPVADAFTPFDAFLPPDAYFECRTDTDCRDDGDVCTEVACVLGLCDTTTIPCDDGVACTVDGCSSPSGCQHVPDSARCADRETCHPTRGCEPADACTDAAECDDGLFCTIDACTAMRCTNNARTCAADSSACTTTTCDEVTDACVHPFDPASLTDPTHCGSSAAMCTAPCPARANADVTCSGGTCGFTCRAGFVNLDGSAANGCEYACTFMSSTDPADTSALDANCDGADGVVGSLDFIYVSPTGLSTGTGSRPSTAVNLARAFTVATGRGSPVTMLLVTGTYPITVPLTATNGLTMVGGYQNTVFRTRAANSLVRSVDPIAMDVSVAATFDSVSFETTDQTVPGEYTRTLWVHGSSALVLRNLTVTAGRGPSGTLGAAGGPGTTVGGVGAPGVAGSASAGGAGGGSGPGAGGAGGPASPATEGSPGVGGGCSSGGAGGRGLSGDTCACGTMFRTTDAPAGQPGCPGSVGVQGDSGTGVGAIDASGWSGATSTGGATGLAGVRGGGGGGGSSAFCGVGNAGGGGGGQGGGGGSGGRGGSPGTPGGGSFAILAHSSDVTLVSVTLITRGGGDGGRGGNGGAGAAGGNGGLGGAGGSVATCGGGTVFGGRGGAGGVGGAGGSGGCGAGGLGGPSIGFFGSATLLDETAVTYTVDSGGIGGDACLAPPGGNSGEDGASLDRLLL